MKLLLDSRKLIIAIGEDISFVMHEGVEKWKVSNSLYYIDEGYTIAEIAELPLDVTQGKYFYIDNQFILNPNWNNSVEDIQELNNRINEVLIKKAESELEIDERLTKIELGLI